jgi:hypothetical protein
MADKHYFTPSEEDSNFCARCGGYFMDDVHFRSHEDAQKQEQSCQQN